MTLGSCLTTWASKEGLCHMRARCTSDTCFLTADHCKTLQAPSGLSYEQCPTQIAQLLSYCLPHRWLRHSSQSLPTACAACSRKIGRSNTESVTYDVSIFCTVALAIGKDDERTARGLGTDRSVRMELISTSYTVILHSEALQFSETTRHHHGDCS
jgi:hypothetical protein